MKKYKQAFIYVFIFISGFIICYLCVFPNRKNTTRNVENGENLVLEILKEENKKVSIKKDALLNQLYEDDVDTTGYVFEVLKKMNILDSYCEKIFTDKSYSSFSIDSVISYVDDTLIRTDMDDFYRMIKSGYKFNNSSFEGELFVNICKVVLMNRYLEKYRETALMTGWGECRILPRKDTLKVGEMFEADICFCIKNVSNKFTMVFPDKKIKMKDDVYREIAQVKGFNKRSCLIPISNGDGVNLYYPAEFVFYVK